MLPSEGESAKLEHLSSLYLDNNQLTGREPFYVPKFLLELPRYLSIYIYLYSIHVFFHFIILSLLSFPFFSFCFMLYLLS